MAIDGSQSFAIGDVVGAFGLPLGVAILFQNIFAVWAALVYLWLDVLITGVFLVILFYKPELQKRGDFTLRDTVIIVTGQVVLLGFLFWNRRKQRQERCDSSA
jgi:hypothetical protein